MLRGVLGDPRFEGHGGLFTLRAPRQLVDQAVGEVELVDPEGVPLARVTSRTTYPADDLTGLVGSVQPLQHNDFGAFRLYLSPARCGTLALRRPYRGGDKAR